MFFVVTVVIAAGLTVLRIYLRLTLGRCKSSVCLIGKTALITGGNSGLGFQTALALASRGCRVIIAARNNLKEAKDEIIRQTGNTNIAVHYLDLSSLASVRKLANTVKETEDRLDILINNAGTGALGNSYTADELHIMMQVNHFGPFLLTHLLTELLKKSAPSRIIFVSSLVAVLNNLSVENLNYPKSDSKDRYSRMLSYSNSKLCNIIAANEFARKLKGSGVTANSLHPGLVFTQFFEKVTSGKTLEYWFVRYFLLPFSKDPEEGAQTTIYLALAKELEEVTGKYFVDCRYYGMPRVARDEAFCKKIWAASKHYTKLTPEDKL